MLRTVFLSVVFGWVGVSAQDSAKSFDPPPALLRMYEARAALETGIVDVGFEDFRGNQRKFDNRTYRFAGNDEIFEGRGDEDGVVWRDTAGNPTDYADEIAFALRKDGELWIHREFDWGAQIKPDGSHLIVADARTFGLMYGFSHAQLDKMRWKDSVRQPSARKYSETIENGLHVVTAESDVGRIRWWIDPRRGWSPVRCALYVDGALFSESRSVLKQYDGVWYPEAVQYWVKGHKDGREPNVRITTKHAEFNHPEHPREFTPEDVAIVPRVTAIHKYDRKGVRVNSGGYVPGVGYEPVTKDYAYAKQMQEVLARQARAKAAGASTATGGAAETPRNAGAATRRSTSLRKFDSEWEAYTRAFIARYELDKTQTQKAWTICHECQTRGATYLASVKGRIERAEKRLAAARKSAEPQRIPEARQIEGVLAGLRKPIGVIFEKQLKPRLDKLPTRAQRARAEQARTGKPERP